jgi:hypothetical protein
VQFLDAFGATFISIVEVVWPIVSTLIFILGVVWSTIKAWPFIRKVFNLVDTLAGLPEELENLQVSSDRKEAVLGELTDSTSKLGKKLDDHIASADEKTAVWDGLLIEVKDSIGKIDKFDAELTHNGGSSIKDSIARLELRLAGEAVLPGETLEAASKRVRNSNVLTITAPGTVDVVAPVEGSADQT